MICAPDEPAAANGQAEVDTDTIRRTYEAGLWAWDTQRSPSEQEWLGDLLRGHVQLLLPEVAAYALRMRGEQQRTAVHVITRTRRLLEDSAGTASGDEPCDVHALATQCRALLTLHQHPGPLDEPTTEDDVTESQP
jgi:hypothetical protein